MVKVNRKIRFDINKLKKKDADEIKKVAAHHATQKLTYAQLEFIGFHAKEALDAIQSLAKDISASQENALKANAFANKNAHTTSTAAQENCSNAEEKRDAYRNSETMHSETTKSNEQMNRDNNSVWKLAIGGVVAIAAIGTIGYAVSTGKGTDGVGT